jgi:phytoene/squalene synthetase
MMAVMAFDTHRRDRLISQWELAEYSRYLSTAVTDALHYFIGHDDPTPDSEARYLAVTGAHITHLLRDTFEDIEAGYYNIPCEFLERHKITARDVYTDAYREWVKSRVQLARECFEHGRNYIRQVKNRRCRIAGYAYIARFETVLDLIEKDNFWLRPEYGERKSLRGGIFMGWSLLSMMLKDLIRGKS